MKTIGLIGGMSWESTAQYYRLLNEGVREALGGLHSARIAMVSVDFAPIEALQVAGDWDGAGARLAAVARSVQAAGADFILLCTNTMHIVAPAIEAAIEIPLVHLADATAEAVLADGCDAIGLLGTRFTMEEDFYRARLAGHGLDVIVPGPEDRETVHRVIYDELCLGQVRDESRGLVLGCTEIGMLVKQSDTGVLLVDTAAIHAEKAVEYALAD